DEEIDGLVEQFYGPGVSAADLEGFFDDLKRGFAKVGGAVKTALPGMAQGAWAERGGGGGAAGSVGGIASLAMSQLGGRPGAMVPGQGPAQGPSPPGASANALLGMLARPEVGQALTAALMPG